MLAKGRLLGVQFETAFTDNLYMEMAQSAIDKANQIRKAVDSVGIPYFVKNDTNQIFVTFEDGQLEELSQKYVFSYQERVDKNHSAVRICTSWATSQEAVDTLCRDLLSLTGK